MSAAAILAKAQSSRAVIQDFVPLAESLEWQLGQEYLRQRGNKAFLSDASPVPFVINNDGTLSRNAAEVFFASLADAEERGPLEEQLFVLELGIGVGLFARYFLDAFRELCSEHNKDYYDRLCYIAADRSERMLLDVCRHGVLANHPGRYRLRLVDAMKPGERLPQDVMFQGLAGKPLRAVFLNYLLDCLPAAVLEIEADGAEVKQLCVRTCVARNVRLEDHTDLTADSLAQRAKTNDAAAQRDLLEVYGLFASEYDYRPVDPKTLPYGEFALEFGRTKTNKLLHSYGAIQALERLLELVHDDGFILANDYGQTQVTARDEFEHQRFSLATFVGVNFSLLKAYFEDGRRCQYVKPFSEGEGVSIYSRLLGHNLSYKTSLRFEERFSHTAATQLQEPTVKARECIRVGRFELASSYYQQALAKQPANWVLLSEVAQFLIFSLRDVKAGIDLAKVALALNPTCSSELWNVLGDGLFEYGRYPEARSAYQKALEVNSSDVRARYNLAWVHQREKNYAAALAVIAEALALDKTGQYRERLLQKQSEVVAQQVQRHQQEYLLLVNLVSKYAASGRADQPKHSENGAVTEPRTA
jgi:tetratricopeptide (TPR) repeat protein